MLKTYFRSGWAFFIPYLAAYLLYAWLKWPVKPVDGGQRTVVPCLLHVYWALHAVHLALGAFALRSWWKESKLRLQLSSSTGAPGDSASLLHSPLSLLLKAAPWLLLALLFYIPGIYLEWPSDPWEHLRRINEWRILDEVTAHSAWMKSSYFLPYSLTQQVTGLTQLSWLNFYYTAVCLLLSWQYYRLARAVGLSDRASFVFVLLNALTFGNNIFSFYRYYGLSSSILAQIGAVALTRLALEVAQNPQLSIRVFFRTSITAYRLSLIAAVPTLLALTGFNHIQGIGIAGLGVMAVIVWRLIEWKRSMLFWLAATAVLVSIATVLWFPRHSLLDSELRNNGWITAWYGFKHFMVGSAAFYNMIGTIGVFGIFGLAAGLLLLRQNNVAGWLTVAPFLFLVCPAFTIPLASAIAEGITVFSRMFLAVPAGLALVKVGRATLFLARSTTGIETDHKKIISTAAIQFAAACGFLSAVLVTSSSEWGPNRAPHFLTTLPVDLQLKGLLSIKPDSLRVSTSIPWRLVTPAPVASVLHTLHPQLIKLSERRDCIARPVSGSILSGVAVAASNRPIRAGEVASENKDPWAGERKNWTFLDQDAAEFITLERHATSRTALQNPAGRRCTVLTAELIPIDPRRAYFVELSVRQRSDTKATAYLVIAWYDATGRFLRSSQPGPRGAGYPSGWGNGTFSYFGLIQDVVPAQWTTYRISMGPTEPAAIPEAAAFVRIGAILNDSSSPEARIQMTGVHIWQKYPGMLLTNGVFPENEHVYILLVSPLALFSSVSYSAYFSRHWPTNQVASDLAGGAELSALAVAVARGPAPIIVNIGTPSATP